MSGEILINSKLSGVPEAPGEVANHQLEVAVPKNCPGGGWINTMEIHTGVDRI